MASAADDIFCQGDDSLLEQGETPIHYLDWAASAPLRPSAVEAMMPFLRPGLAGIEQGGANANALYECGRTAFKQLEAARQTFAHAIGARPDEVIFTSGATEANNTALSGMIDALMLEEEHHGHIECVPRVIISAIEHDSVMQAARQLHTWGAEVLLLQPQKDGRIAPETLALACQDGAALVSVMAVNNEIGSVMDVPALARIAHDAGALFHVDATQALGHVPVDVHAWGVDAASFSAHKVGGPKGVGALYLKARTPFSPQLVGGGQETGRRSGTQNVCGAFGFAVAAADAVADLPHESKRQMALRDACYATLCELPGVEPVVPVAHMSEDYAPHIVTVTVEGYESETLILQLSRRGICISGGSACSSNSLEPSHVLKALGMKKDRALSSLRVSLGWFTTQEDIEALVSALREVINKK